MYPPIYAPDHKHTATVTIGRSIGNEPMDADRWQEFIRELGIIVRTRGLRVYTYKAIGTGHWADSRGEFVTEESCTYVYELEEAAAGITASLLHDLAMKYEQDSIALVLGQTIFC